MTQFHPRNVDGTLLLKATINASEIDIRKSSGSLVL